MKTNHSTCPIYIDSLARAAAAATCSPLSAYIIYNYIRSSCDCIYITKDILWSYACHVSIARPRCRLPQIEIFPVSSSNTLCSHLQSNTMSFGASWRRRRYRTSASPTSVFLTTPDMSPYRWTTSLAAGFPTAKDLLGAAAVSSLWYCQPSSWRASRARVSLARCAFPLSCGHVL